MIYLAAAFVVMLIGWPLAIYAEGYANRQMKKDIRK
jgi:ABC-type phosphate transport system permease subunit